MKKIILSLLLILTACKNLDTSIENIAPPSKSVKGDGYIFFNYLNYDKTLTVFDGESSRIVFRTKADDVQKLTIVSEGKDFPMVSIGKMGDFEYFEGKAKNLKNKEFYFLVQDGNLDYYFGQKASLNKKEMVPFVYDDESLSVVQGDSKLWYRVYVDSFYNGNRENDPVFNEYGPESFFAPTDTLKNGVTKESFIDGWGINEPKKILGNFELSQWNDDFNNSKNWEKKAKNIYGDDGFSKRFGGDLKGIELKIPYLKDYGVKVLWISSPFYSFSGSKNDIIDFRHISPDYGNIIDSNGTSEYKMLKTDKGTNGYGESLDKNSWVNTESDQYFISLIQKLKTEGISVISDIRIDYVSDRFFAFEDVLKNGTKSKYINWFNVAIKDDRVSYDRLSDIGVENIDGIRYRNTFVEIKDEYSPEDKKELLAWNKNHMSFESLGTNKNLVKLNLDNKEVQNYLIEASKKWLDAGLGGYMLRADEPKAFYETWEKTINPQGKYTIKYDFTDNDKNDKFKSLNYELSDVLGKFLSVNSFTGEDLYTNIYILNRNTKNINFIEGIDVDRLSSVIINGFREYDTENEQSGNYLGINPLMIDDGALSKYKIGIFIQFLLSGSQSIYYGSEKFMWGGDVPHNRKPMIWDEFYPYMDESDGIKKYENKKESLDTKIIYDQVEGQVRYKVPVEKTMESFYKSLIKFRKDNENLINNGYMDKIKTGDNLLIFSKTLGKETYIFLINKGNKEEKVITNVGEGKELVDYFTGDKKSILKGNVELTLPKQGFTIYKKIEK